ncbi:MAG: twin-arginine translocase subunit TatB [Alphaproteobacteria bacterium]|nr:twin-arginine translocase subunit TatB [Alphaproteobacteria bacterium]
MLFDIGWSELLLIGVVALVVIGPKDLPRALRIAGYWVGKARSLSREFHSSIDQMMREAELEEMRQELKKATEINIEHEFQKTVDPTGSLAESLKPPALPDFFEPAPALVEPVPVEPMFVELNEGETRQIAGDPRAAAPGLPVAEPPPTHGFDPPPP